VGRLGEHVQVQADEDGRGHGDHPRPEDENEHPAQLGRHVIERRTVGLGRIRRGGPAPYGDHEQDPEYHLQHQADDHAVVPQRAVPVPSGFSTASVPASSESIPSAAKCRRSPSAELYLNQFYGSASRELFSVSVSRSAS
jgi:hypothetical protein